jgi:hypothetical protein
VVHHGELQADLLVGVRNAAEIQQKIKSTPLAARFWSIFCTAVGSMALMLITTSPGCAASIKSPASTMHGTARVSKAENAQPLAVKSQSKPEAAHVST